MKQKITGSKNKKKLFQHANNCLFGIIKLENFVIAILGWKQFQIIVCGIPAIRNYIELIEINLKTYKYGGDDPLSGDRPLSMGERDLERLRDLLKWGLGEGDLEERRGDGSGDLDLERDLDTDLERLLVLLPFLGGTTAASGSGLNKVEVPKYKKQTI